jgi:hypothetical protein
VQAQTSLFRAKRENETSRAPYYKKCLRKKGPLASSSGLADGAPTFDAWSSWICIKNAHGTSIAAIPSPGVAAQLPAHGDHEHEQIPTLKDVHRVGTRPGGVTRTSLPRSSRAASSRPTWRHRSEPFGRS